MEDLIGSTFISKEGSVDINEIVDSPIIGLYFSAHWCPPCRVFTPTLCEFYESMNKEAKKLEIIFISSDRTVEEYNEYFSQMPWKAIQFGDPRIPALKKHFEVKGIPFLVIMNKDTKILSTDGRLEIVNNKEDVYQIWEDKSTQNIE